MNIETLMKSHDFTPWHTGGGCMAYGHKLENGDEILITDNDCGLPETNNTPCIVGLYNKYGEELAMWESETVPAALHHAKFSVSEYYLEYEQDLYHILNRG